MNIQPKFTKIAFASLTSQTPAVGIPNAKGRNGEIKMSGVEVYADDYSNLVRLTPITSRGDVTPACYLEAPLDKETLTSLADVLLRLAEQAPERPVS